MGHGKGVKWGGVRCEVGESGDVLGWRATFIPFIRLTIQACVGVPNSLSAIPMADSRFVLGQGIDLVGQAHVDVGQI